VYSLRYFCSILSLSSLCLSHPLHFRVTDARRQLFISIVESNEDGQLGRRLSRKRAWQSAIGEDVKLQSAVTARSFAREQQVIHHNQRRTKRTGKWTDDRLRRLFRRERQQKAGFHRFRLTQTVVKFKFLSADCVGCNIAYNFGMLST